MPAENDSKTQKASLPKGLSDERGLKWHACESMRLQGTDGHVLCALNKGSPFPPSRADRK